MDICMDIHGKSVEMDMDMDVIFHIHDNPDEPVKRICCREPCTSFICLVSSMAYYRSYVSQGTSAVLTYTVIDVQ